MTNEEIAVALRHCAKSGTCQDCPNNPKSDLLPRCSVLTDAADIIEKLTTDYDDAILAIDALDTSNDILLKENEGLRNVLESQPSWVSVNDHLPNVDKYKNSIDYESVYVIGWYNNKSIPLIYERAMIRRKTEYRWKFVFNVIIPCQSLVTHWMPLPELPSERIGDESGV